MSVNEDSDDPGFEQAFASIALKVCPWGFSWGRYRAQPLLVIKSFLLVGQPRKRNRYQMVKTNSTIYIRKSSDDGTSSSDNQLHELDVISYPVSLS